MTRTPIRVLASLVTTYALGIFIAAQSPQTNSREVITKARGGYYNLRNHGFTGFTAVIEPNWEVTLGPTATKQNLKVFRALRFSMVVDANGTVNVSREFAEAGKTRVGPYAAQIHENIQRLVAGFFGTWARFVIDSPFPQDETQAKIESSGVEYRVFYMLESANIGLALSDGLITEWKLTLPSGTRTITPSFQKTGAGLLLKSYKSLYEPVGNGVKTTLDVTIEYQDVEGMKLPHKIGIRGVYGSDSIAAELRFNQLVLNPRPIAQITTARRRPQASAL